MGSSTSKYEAPMPPLPQMKPMSILPVYTAPNEKSSHHALPEYNVRNVPVQLEFGKHQSSRISIKDVTSGEDVFEVEDVRYNKIQIRMAHKNRRQQKVLLNIYSSFWGLSWEVKGDNEQRGQNQVKSHLFDISCDKKRIPGFKVEFLSDGKKIVWHIKADKQRQSIVVINEDGTLIGHGGLRERKSFPKSTSFVLTVAPGIDYSMLVAVFICRLQYLRKKSRSNNSVSAASAGAFAGASATAGAGGGGGGC